MSGRIASGAGLAVGGNSPASRAVEAAMRSEIVKGHEAGEDPAAIRARLMAVRFGTKPPERC